MKKPVIINHSNIFPTHIHNLFPNADIVNFKHFNAEHIESYDYTILSGGEINISGIDDIKVEKDWLRTTKKPIFGICLGMQILSILEGQILKPIGHRINQKNTLELFNISGDMVYHHGWYIENIPNGYDGTIRDGRLDYIYNDNRLAFQGHPELSGSFGLEIKDLFLSRFT